MAKNLAKSENERRYDEVALQTKTTQFFLTQEIFTKSLLFYRYPMLDCGY
jgi:hypothetical protein